MIDRIGIRWVQVERTTVISAQPFDTVVEKLAVAVGHPDKSLFWRDLAGARLQISKGMLTRLSVVPV